MTNTRIQTSTWTIDPAHSVAEFSVKHMMVSTVKGRFHKLEGKLHIDEQEPANSWVEARIETSSIDTGEPQRDGHLRSPDFFDVESFPAITFRSTRVEMVDEDNWKVYGDLTIRDATHPVILDTEFEGQLKDAWGKQRAAFNAKTEISRKDWGLNWNVDIEAGGFLVSDRVKIELDIAAVREG